MTIHFSIEYYPVYAKGTGQVIHIMKDDWGQTGSTPTGLFAPPKKTLCGKRAVKNMQDVFTVRDADCRECAVRYSKV